MERPVWITEQDQRPAVSVDWTRLPDDWRTRSHKLRRADETKAEMANRLRAGVAEGLLGAEALAFADSLDGVGS